MIQHVLSLIIILFFSAACIEPHRSEEKNTVFSSDLPNQKDLQGRLLLFEGNQGGCTKSYKCWAGTCGHFRSVILERDHDRIVLVPTQDFPFELLKKFKDKQVQIEAEYMPGKELDPLEQHPSGETYRPGSFRVLSIKLRK